MGSGKLSKQDGPVSMARSRRAPADRVLDAAHELFRQQSIDAVGVDTISARSGVSKSTLYRHFPSKGALVEAYLRRHHDRRLQEWVDAVQGGGGDPVERMLGVFDWLGVWFGSEDFRGCRFLNAAVQLPDPAHPAFGIPAQHKESVRGLLVELGEEAGVPDPDELAYEIALLIDGAIMHALLEGSPQPAARAKHLARLAVGARGVAPAD